MKNKETLEEFIQRQLSLDKYQDQESAIKYSILAGAKWQQEQDKNLYSEEEVYNILEQAMKDCYSLELEAHYSGDYKNLKQYFEQFKKK